MTAPLSGVPNLPDRPAGSEAPAVVAAGLRKRFGPVDAVDGLGLGVPRGAVYGLVGPDGAGKTTTLRLLCGIVGADAGEMRVAGCDVRRDPERVKRRVGYLAQRFALYGDLTVGENIRFFADVYGVPRAAREARTAELLTLTQLAPFTGRLAEYLSGGMRQKLGLVCALIHRPEVLFLDEPTSGVDPPARRDLWRLLHRLNREGLTLVVATPYMDEAVRCHVVGFMQRGRLLAEGPPAALAARLGAGGDRRVEAHLEDAFIALSAGRVAGETPATPGRGGE
ncbi:MAG TPA: ABC transporter ATP-binding protein [Chloroflexota bacterium]|nr:ABC transporter ATP-binding protein [Chloroflexota bacterium]